MRNIIVDYNFDVLLSYHNNQYRIFANIFSYSFYIYDIEYFAFNIQGNSKCVFCVLWEQVKNIAKII